MKFFTAFRLSLNNLMTKKGRTILTSFAGSIGIIGIALILSISNGVQNYINKVEEETLSSYPITIISVLERTKEIGILRAIGASKKDISRVFNAETFIIGLISGLIGIGVTVLLSIPINSLIYSLTGVAVNVSLPFGAGVILVVISMFLTIIAGLIPAKMASKKDPVEALRTE